MLYSKRRKNLGGGRRKRSNRKSFKAVMSGGSVPYNYQPDFSTPHITPSRDVNVLCNLIYENTPIYSKQFSPFFTFQQGEYPRLELFKVNELQIACINGVSRLGFSPLYTACKNHSSIELIKYLLQYTQQQNMYVLFGIHGGDRNTAAHAVAFSYCINNSDILRNSSNIQQLHKTANSNLTFARSVEDKFKILDLFKSRQFDFNTQNQKANGSLGETVWDLIYELETLKCKNRINQYISHDKPLHKYTDVDIRESYLIPFGWMRMENAQNQKFYVNSVTRVSQLEKPRV